MPAAGPGSSEARQIAAALVARPPAPSAPGSGPALPTRTEPPRPADPVVNPAAAAALVAPVAPAGQPAPVQPQAIQPQAAQRRKPPKVQPGKPTRTPQKGDLICGECGEANPPGRKFCSRCGTSLAAAVVVRIRWWKRIFHRKPKSAMAGERPWTAGAGGKKKPKRKGIARFIGPVRRFGGIALLVLGLVYGVYSPFRNWVNDRYTGGKDKVMSIIHPQFDQVTVGPGTTSNEVSSNPDHPATMAVDGFKNTYWLTAPPTDGFRPELDVQLTDKVDLAKVIVRTGASDDFQGHHRPKTLLFIFDTGASYEVQLKNTPDPQTVTIHNGKDVQHFKIAVTAIYESLNGTDLGLTEIEFFKKK
ncbi:MAG: zinc-ribbon domain-containing protein [Ilumatobacteraceae bacterium]